MRSFVQTSRQCRNHAVIDLEGLVSYIRAYCTEFPLTKRDLISMPYVYLFQLARSKYGYSQYLHSDSEDRLGLLNFALWRTQMCRQVESRLTEISEALVQLR